MNVMTLERSRVIDAPVSRVWEVISDLDDYHAHTGTLASTKVVSGEGHGAIRWCVDSSGNEWEEACTVWEPGQQYEIEVDVSTYPTRHRTLFKSFRGTWTVEPVEGGTLTSIRFDAGLRRIPGLSTLASRLAERGGSDIEEILESYRRAAEQPGIR